MSHFYTGSHLGTDPKIGVHVPSPDPEEQACCTACIQACPCTAAPARRPSHSLSTCRYKEELRQGSFQFPGSFGTAAKGSRLPTFVPKNAANTNIVPWQGGLLAMFESGQPHHLQAGTLETRGLELLAGVLHAGVPLQTPSSLVDAAVGDPQALLQRGNVLDGCCVC